MWRIFEMNSIRSRMLSGFLFLIGLIALLLVVSLFMLRRSANVTATQSSINRLQVLTLHLIRIDNDFFDLGTLEEGYFRDHKSQFLHRHDSLVQRIHDGLAQLKVAMDKSNYPTPELLTLIEDDFSEYHATFHELEQLLFERGFRDYGVEGAMRLHAHALENERSAVALSDVLSLRRREKDFLLRHDLTYRDQFNQLANRLRQSSGRPKQTSSTIDHLTEYQNQFNRMVEIVVAIGLTSQDGLRHELNQLTARLSARFDELSVNSNLYTTGEQNRFIVYFVAMMVLAIIFMVFWGYWVSKRLSAPIARLSHLIHAAVKNRAAVTQELRTQHAAVEINALTTSFVELLEQTHLQLKVIRKKSRLLRHRNLELKKLNKELDHFLYSTAHDLRSPLSSLSGLVRLAEIENKQDEMKFYFAMMRDSIQRQEEFIRQIVTYARNKKLQLQVELVDLRDLIEKTLADHLFIEGASKIQIQTVVRQDVPFYSDQNRLQILFNNLISNAIRYADLEKSNPSIRISAQVNEDEAYIEFIDNGMGIDESHLSRIFDMFYRAHVGSKGSGLGLFIFKKTIQRLKGQVQVESKVKEGTKFLIRLPNGLRTNQQLELTTAKAS
jgi:signal transduction histidine kinase